MAQGLRYGDRIGAVERFNAGQAFGGCPRQNTGPRDSRVKVTLTRAVRQRQTVEIVRSSVPQRRFLIITLFVPALATST
jgi:hypothetical protein